MAKIEWPAADRTSLIGGRITRIDGLEKTTGEAKYTYDINLDNQLIAVALGCPHGHCKIITLDAAPAEKVKGVVHVELLRKAGDEIEWEGELLAVVAAESEGAAREGVAKLRDALKYEELEVFVDDDDLEAAEKAGRTSKAGDKVQIEREPGDDDDEDEFIDEEIARLLKESKHVVEGDLRHRRHHPLLPGAARLDRRVEGRQAQRLPLHAERVGDRRRLRRRPQRHGR
jgi:xanthine dehydrogenase YagR molybdenum-binding subunit